MKTIRYWLARLYVAGSISVTVLIAMLDKDSKHYQSLESDGFNGYGAMGFILAMAIFAVMDVFLNDFLPKKFTAQPLRDYRHLIFIGLAGGQLCMVMPNVLAGNIEPFLARYLLDATVALVIACLDLRLQWGSRSIKVKP